MRKERARRSRSAIWIAVAFGVVYLITLSRLNSLDAVTGAWHVLQFSRTGDSAWLFPPQDFLFKGVTYLLFRLFKTIFSGAHPLLAAQVLSAVFATVAIYHFHDLARRFSGQDWSASVASAGLACSVVFWSCATDGGPGTAAVLLMIITLGLAIKLIQGGNWRVAAWMGVSIGGAALLQLTQLLLLPAGIAAVWAKKGGASRSRRVLAFSGSLAGVLCLPHLISYGAFRRIPAAPDTGVSRIIASHASPMGILRGFLGAIVDREPLSIGMGTSGGPFDRLAAVAFLMLAVLIGGVLIWGLVKLALKGHDRATMAISLLIAVCYVVFSAFVSPSDTTLWLSVVVVFWVVVAGTAGKWKPPPMLRFFHQSLLGLAVITVFGINLYYSILPRMILNTRRSQPDQAAMLATRTRPGDLVLASGVPEESEMRLRYFSERNILTLNSLVLKAGWGGDPDRMGAIHRELQHELDKTIKRGGRVFVLDELVRDDDCYAPLGGLTRDEFIEFMDGYDIRRTEKDPCKLWELKEK